MATETEATSASRPARPALLDRIERLGNRLPDPTTLFVLGALIVMVVSHLAVLAEIQVAQTLPTQGEDGELVWEETGEVFAAESLLSRDGIDWAIRSMVDNFMAFPPLGVVLVGMLGIGVAERTGLIAAALKLFMAGVPNSLLTPAVIFIGVMSSMTLDAGYVVLPPLAAALYYAAGRSPLAGIAAVFAGVSAGFNANLFLTGLDPMLAGYTLTGAIVVDPGYHVNAACNWWFMIASTVLITLTGWAVTSWFVERRLAGRPADEGGPPVGGEAIAADAEGLQPDERRGLKVAGGAFALVMALIFAAVLVPGAPLYTYQMPDADDANRTVIAEVYQGDPAEAPPEAQEVNGRLLVPSERPFARWVDAIVPLLFVSFIVPAVAFGMVMQKIRRDRDVAKLMMESMAAMAPIIVLAFVAAQFVAYFSYSGLDRMLATAGGQWLGQAEMGAGLLIVAFIGLTIVFNLFIGSMSAKYALFAPIFVPMFMMVGISPELSQAAYRIGDSVSNIITPLNAYLIIILVYMQRYVPRGGMGTLIATMFPYTLAFTAVWVTMLLVWMQMGWPLGPDGPLTYDILAR
ncbi:MAG: AbgT family transporter [Phycisphaeraceae bacterium]